MSEHEGEPPEDIHNGRYDQEVHELKLGSIESPDKGAGAPLHGAVNEGLVWRHVAQLEAPTIQAAV